VKRECIYFDFIKKRKKLLKNKFREQCHKNLSMEMEIINALSAMQLNTVTDTLKKMTTLQEHHRQMR
jgi:hypothetical protein